MTDRIATIYRQPNNIGQTTEQQYTHIHNRRNKKEADRDEENEMEDNTPLGQGACRDKGK